MKEEAVWASLRGGIALLWQKGLTTPTCWRAKQKTMCRTRDKTLAHTVKRISCENFKELPNLCSWVIKAKCWLFYMKVVTPGTRKQSKKIRLQDICDLVSKNKRFMFMFLPDFSCKKKKKTRNVMLCYFVLVVDLTASPKHKSSSRKY